MDSARIAALLERFLDHPLSPAQLDQISTYIDLLLRWNARINLTAIRTPEEIVTRHFGESFFMARHLFPSLPTPPSTPCHPERSQAASEASGSAESKDPYPTAADRSKGTEAAKTKPDVFALFAKDGNSPQPPRVIDLGSGAGFPALPLKIWAPQIHLTLIESNHKKASFLREVARALTLMDVNVVAERAETLSLRLGPDFPRADIVTFRAVEKFDQALPLAATFLSPTARLALLIGSAQISKLATLHAMTWQNRNVPQSQVRVLSIGRRT